MNRKNKNKKNKNKKNKNKKNKNKKITKCVAFSFSTEVTYFF